MTTTDLRKSSFIEEMGILIEGFGLPRMWGRVLGALLLADPPEQSAEQLAEALGASRGSISTATRMLEQTRLIDRVRRPNDRKDYFRNRPGAWHDVNLRRMEVTHRALALADRGLELLENGDPEVRRGLEELREFMAFMAEQYPKMLQRWMEEHAARHARR